MIYPFVNFTCFNNQKPDVECTKSTNCWFTSHKYIIQAHVSKFLSATHTEKSEITQRAHAVQQRLSEKSYLFLEECQLLTQNVHYPLRGLLSRPGTFKVLELQPQISSNDSSRDQTQVETKYLKMAVFSAVAL